MKKLLLSLVLVASFAPVFAMDSGSDSDDATSVLSQASTNATAPTDATAPTAANQTSDDSGTDSDIDTSNLTKAEKFKASVKAKASSVRATLSDATDYVKDSKAGHIVSTHPVAFKRFGIAAIVAGAIYTAKKVYNRYQARQAEKATENENA
ncbi:MAG: hypothetical protein ACD_64C00299G0003 [uncultured bacterium]|nr:MAG: hypothetical protein ACD_64C00299G0003 [uncultured bacterium]